jgi:hypothetical protein
MYCKLKTFVLNHQPNSKSFGDPAEAGPSSNANSSAAVPRTATPQEDEVDLLLYKMPGTIQRERDEKL